MDRCQDARKPTPRTAADLRALLRRHRRELTRRVCALARQAGWPTSHSTLLEILAADEAETIRGVLEILCHLPSDAEPTTERTFP